MKTEELIELARSDSFYHKQTAVLEMYKRGWTVSKIIEETGIREFEIRYFLSLN